MPESERRMHLHIIIRQSTWGCFNCNWRGARMFMRQRLFIRSFLPLLQGWMCLASKQLDCLMVRNQVCLSLHAQNGVQADTRVATSSTTSKQRKHSGTFFSQLLTSSAAVLCSPRQLGFFTSHRHSSEAWSSSITLAVFKRSTKYRPLETQHTLAHSLP